MVPQSKVNRNPASQHFFLPQDLLFRGSRQTTTFSSLSPQPEEVADLNLSQRADRSREAWFGVRILLTPKEETLDGGAHVPALGTVGGGEGEGTVS